MDRCINADYYASNDGTNIMADNNYHFLNNELHHCGQEGIHDSDDWGQMAASRATKFTTSRRRLGSKDVIRYLVARAATSVGSATSAARYV